MKKLILITVLIMMSACGMNRPFPPTLTSLTGNSTTAYGSTSTYLGVYDLADAHLDWDVSNVVGAEGVRIIASREYTCKTEIASNVLYIINSRQYTSANGGIINPMENLRTIFSTSLSSFTTGQYYICVRAIKMGKESAPSYPVTISLMQNQSSYLTVEEQDFVDQMEEEKNDKAAVISEEIEETETTTDSE